MPKINNDFDKIMLHCGFNRRYNLKEISEDGFESFEDIMLLNEKYIVNISKEFSERTAANRRIILGFRRNNLLRKTMHWVQNLQRISRDTTIDGIEDKSTFKERIDASRVR